MGLAGLGDLTLTCTSEKSRNYSYGLALGRGQPFVEGTTIEGQGTARAVHRAARAAGASPMLLKTGKGFGTAGMPAYCAASARSP